MGIRCDAAPAPPAPHASAEPEPVTLPAIEFDGCAAVRRGRRCLIDEDGAELTLWIAAAPTPALEVLVDGAPLPDARDDGAPGVLRRRYVDGGQQIRITVGGAAQRVRVRHPTAGVHSELELGPAPRAADLRVAAVRLLHGDLPGAVTRVVPLLVDGLVQLRRRCYAAGRHDAAVTVAGWTVAVAGPAGLVSELSEAAQAAAYLLTQQPPRDAGRAARFLAAEATTWPDFPAAAACGPYYAGLVAYAAGDLRTALRDLARAEVRARRLGLVTDMVTSAAMHTVLLGQIGRSDEVMARVRIMDTFAAEITSCEDRAILLTDLGVAEVALLEAGLLVEDPVPLFSEALELYEHACPDAEQADVLRTNLALAALVQGDLEEAQPWLESLRDHALGPVAALWLPELEARAALLGGRGGSHDDPVLEPGRAELDDPELRWPALMSRAHGLAAWGLREPAIASLRDAERLLDVQLYALGVDEGREQLMASRRRSAELLVDLLVDAGRPGEALCVARLARVRALQAVDRAARITSLGPAARLQWDAHVAEHERHHAQAEAARRDRWRFVGAALVQHDARIEAAEQGMRRALDDAYALLGPAGAAPTCADLAAPAEGELTLLVQAVPDGLIAFAADAAGVAVTRLAALDGGDLDDASRRLLAPFAARLQYTRTLRVLGSSALAGVPVHALPWGDDIVLAAMAVVYGLDLPRPRAPAIEPGATAVVVADPTGNLAHARAEAELVGAALRDRGWQVQVPVAAGGAALRAALAGAHLLHYAGHGRSEGLGGWDSVLVLGDDDTLGIGDILALPRVPPAVVLSGCETGASDAHALAGGMNLGRAFLLAGARTVIAATGALDDAIAAEVGAELYRDATPGRPLDGPAALRRALLKVRAAHPGDTAWMQLHALAP